MIIENGTIQVKQKGEGGGIDPETGYMRKASGVTWGDPIACQFYPNRYSNLGRVSGERFKTAEYTVLIEGQEFTAEQICLKDEWGALVGEFSVISAEPLQAVGQVKITI